MKKLVRESILFEKFEEADPDPVASMGIGGFSFESLSRGAIIAAKVPRLSLKSDGSGYFTYPGKGIDLPVGYPIIVVSVRDYIITGHKIFQLYIGDNDMDEAMKERLKLKEANATLGYWGSKTKMIINKKKFYRMFDILERGF